MNEQDKLAVLLERNGWEKSDPPEDVSYRFRIYEYYEDDAYNDCYCALGMVSGLDTSYRRFWVQKEGPYYAGYIEF